MSPRARRLLLAAFVAVALGFAAYVLLGRWEDLRRLRAEVAGHPWHASPGWLAAALALWLAALVGTAAAWVRLFRASGAGLSYRVGAGAWLVSNLGRYIPGKVWQLSSLALIVRRRGESGTAAVATSVVLQAVTVLTGLAFGVLVLDPTGGEGGAGGLSPLRLLLLALALGLLAHPRVVRLATRLVSRWTEGEAAGVELPGREVVRAAAFLSGAWLAYGVGFWCFLRGILPRAPGPAAAVGIFAASYVAGFAVFVAPGGLVAREGAMTALLASVAGFPVGVAAVAAVAARLGAAASEVAALGLGAWGMRGRGESGRRGRGPDPCPADPREVP